MKKSFIASAFLCISLYTIGFSQNTSSDLLIKHVFTLASDSMRGRFYGSQENYLAALYIENQFKEIGLLPYKNNSYFQTFLVNQSIQCRNVVGIIEGNDSVLKQEYIIIGAHYDHLGYQIKNDKIFIFNGADDNASGTAALIELARALKAEEKNLKRSVVLVAFDAEEKGLLGSKFMASQIPIEKVKLMVSMDMVGYYKKSKKLIFKGVATLKDGKEIIKSIPISEKINIEIRDFENSIFTATDTKYFLEEDIPAFHLTTGLKSPYHKPEDDADKIDYEGLRKITDYMTVFTREMSQREALTYSGNQSTMQNKAKILEGGFSVAVGANALHYNKTAFERGRSGFAFSGGAFMQINIKNFFSLRPEFLYEYKNSYFPRTDSFASPADKIRLHAITVPFSLIFRTTIDPSIYFFVGLGGYYTYNFSAKKQGILMAFNKDIYHHEGGMQYSIGLCVYNLRMEIVSRTGLSPILIHKTLNIKNNAYYFQLGVAF